MKNKSRKIEIHIVVATATNNVIGAKGGLPWHYSLDLQRFKQLTTNHVCIMGRLTYQSIVQHLGHALPNRTSIVVSSSDPDLDLDATTAPNDDTKVYHVKSVEDGIKLFVELDQDKPLMVIGGESIYRYFIHHSSTIHLTKIMKEYEGDTYFPVISNHDWYQKSLRSVQENGTILDFITYKRRA